MTLKDWHASLQPREKLLSLGADALSDSELLALFIRQGSRQRSALDIAQQLLQQHGDLSAVVALSEQQYCEQPGAGRVSYCLLQAAASLSARYLQASLRRRHIFESPAAIKQFLANRLRNAKREQFACLFLDGQHQLLAYEVLFQGTINQATVHSRIIAQSALQHNAAALVMVHNHPSGSTAISDADISLTQHVKRCMAWLDITVLDHFIVAGSRIISLKQRGLV